MNNERRQQLAEICKRIAASTEAFQKSQVCEQIADLARDIEVLKESEQRYLDSIPASMYDETDSRTSQEALSNLEYALDDLHEVQWFFEEVVDKFHNVVASITTAAADG